MTTATHETTHERATARDWQDQYFTFVKRIEAPLLRTTARMAGRMAEYVPERPAFLADLPKVHEVMDAGLTFRKRVVDEQTRFARSMMKAMDPMLVKVDTVHHTERHDRRTEKPVAKRAPRAA